MKVSTYSIKDLENLTGIKAHTIRVWEQRYGIVTPKRTQSNIRYYDSDDLKMMLNVALLNHNGYKISKIAKMSREELFRKVRETVHQSSDYQSHINAMTVAMIDLDESQFEKVMATNFLQIGFEQTMINIVYPFLMRVGTLWATDAINPAQEHFITNLIRQKIIVAIDGQLNTARSNAQTYMLYLPTDELHEISLLFATYLIKVRGSKVVYLGQSMPLSDVYEAYMIHKPDYLLTIATSHPGPDKIQQYVDEIAKLFPDCGVLITGYQVIGQDVECPDNVMVLNHIRQLIEFVEEESSRIEQVKK